MNIDRLPKWAQDHIQTITRERDTAVRALNEYVDGQTESGFYYDDFLSLGERRTEALYGGPSSKRIYVQTRAITVVHAGVELDVVARNDGSGPEISIQWGSEHRGVGEIAFIPHSFQCARLKADLRK